MKNLFFSLVIILLGHLSYSQIVVTNTNSSGAGSFLEAINQANVTPGPNVILFDAALTGSTIGTDQGFILSDNATTIDGDIDGNGTPDITIQLGNVGDNLFLIQGSQNIIQGLNLQMTANQSPGLAAIRIDGSSDNSIFRCYIGTDQAGNIAATARFNRGIYLLNGASNNTIGNAVFGNENVISNSLASGIWIIDSPGNFIDGNFIGTDINGSVAIPNGGSGIEVSGSDDIQIGSIRQNVISANVLAGIRMDNSTDARIFRNFIGVDNTGSVDLGNGSDGILLRNGCDDAQIGTGSSTGNIICANAGTGLTIDGSSTVLIAGNQIGLAANNTGLGNGTYGILVTATSSFVNIGSGSSLSRNYISGNGDDGINAASADIGIRNNYIGTDAAGVDPVPNLNGIRLLSTATVIDFNAISSVG
jgi:hypothetical protein